MDLLADIPPCLITIFSNNIHAYLQFCHICIDIIVVFIVYCNSNFLFRKTNLILYFFLGKSSEWTLAYSSWFSGHVRAFFRYLLGINNIAHLWTYFFCYIFLFIKYTCILRLVVDLWSCILIYLCSCYLNFKFHCIIEWYLKRIH